MYTPHPVKSKIPSYIILALCIIIGIATVMNVFIDNQDVITMAEKTVCPNPTGCKYSKTAMMRTPIGQSFTFVGEGKTIELTCRRAYIFLGDYACAAPDAPGAPAASSEPAKQK